MSTRSMHSKAFFLMRQREKRLRAAILMECFAKDVSFLLKAIRKNALENFSYG